MTTDYIQHTHTYLISCRIEYFERECVCCVVPESMEAAGGAGLEKPISNEGAKSELEEKALDLGQEKRRDRSSESESSSGRERLKRHRGEVAGRVWIPEMWGQEDFLKDWIDSTVFDAAVRNSGIMSARAALMEEGRRAAAAGFRIQNSC